MPPFSYGAIDIPKLRKLLEENIDVITHYPGEPVTEVRHAVDNNTQLTRKILLLSAARRKEIKYYTESNGPIADGYELYRVMGVLYFHETFSDGFAIDIFSTAHVETMSKKIRKIQLLFDAFGLPPFSYSIRPNQREIVSLKSKKQAQ